MNPPREPRKARRPKEPIDPYLWFSLAIGLLFVVGLVIIGCSKPETPPSAVGAGRLQEQTLPGVITEDGKYLVGTTLKSGTYASHPPGGGFYRCTASVINGDGAFIFTASTTDSPMEIYLGDGYTFQTTGCAPWQER